MPELIEREELLAAASLQATGFNLARAVRSAIDGLVVAAADTAAVRRAALAAISAHERKD